MPAALPVTATAGPEPIFTVIERHRELSVLCDEAVSISAKLEDSPEFDAADEISAGIRYVASLGEWQVPTDEDWHQVFLSTLANALDRRR